MTPTIDAHMHVWDARRVDYPWLSDADGLRPAYGLDDVRGELGDSGVDQVVLVQAADDPADTELMLEIARSDDLVAGVVAWAPLLDPPEVARRIETWSDDDDAVVGLRHLVHRDPDPDLLLDPRVHESLEILGDHDLTFDICAETVHLLALVPEVAREHPTTTFVIDHLAKPPVRERGWDPWADLLARAAESPNVVAKLSGLNTAAAAGWTGADFAPYVDHALACFGASRMMYGGDWPFALLNATSYAQINDGLMRTLDDLSDDERAAILGETARRVYRLDRDAAPHGAAPRDHS